MTRSLRGTIPGSGVSTREPQDAIILAALMVLAFLVRTILATRWPAISRDGTFFLWMSQSFTSGDFAHFFSQSQHPLFPIVVAGARFLFKDWVWSAYAVGIASAMLLVIPVYLLALHMFGRSAAVASGVFLSLHPALSRNIMEVVSEPLYLLLLLAALGLGFFASRSPTRQSGYDDGARFSVSLAVSSGVFAGLAYLTRPEGVIALLAVGLYLGLGEPLHGRVLPKKLLCLSGFALAFVAVAGSYLIFLRSTEGHWVLSRKKAVSVLLGLEEAEHDKVLPQALEREENHASSPPRRLQPLNAVARKTLRSLRSLKPMLRIRETLSFFGALLKKSGEAFSVPLLFLTLLGLITRSNAPIWNRGLSGKAFLLLFGGLYMVLLGLVFFSAHYVSSRYILPVALAWIPFSALGLQSLARIARWLLKKIACAERSRSSGASRLSHLRPEPIEKVLLIIAAGGLLCLSLDVHGESRLGMKEAGLRIRQDWLERSPVGTPWENAPLPLVLAPAMSLPIFYAGGKYGGEYYDPALNDFQTLALRATEISADYLVVRIKGKGKIEGLPEALPEFLEPLAEPIPLTRGHTAGLLQVYRVKK